MRDGIPSRAGVRGVKWRLVTGFAAPSRVDSLPGAIRCARRIWDQGCEIETLCSDGVQLGEK